MCGVDSKRSTVYLAAQYTAIVAAELSAEFTAKLLSYDATEYPAVVGSFWPAQRDTIDAVIFTAVEAAQFTTFNHSHHYSDESAITAAIRPAVDRPVADTN